MFAAYRNATHAASAYRRVGVETAMTDASPHHLIRMLYDGALEAIGRARHAVTSKDIARRGEATTRAIRILDEGLKAALDPRGGDIADNLQMLYDYMARRLLMANRHGDDMIYAEVATLLGQLRDAWDGMAQPQKSAA
jgi:flagellar protein FliS